MKPQQFASALTVFALLTPLYAHASSLDKRRFEDALKEIGRFESGSDNRWNQVTPDIGRNGISCGILQWSLQEGKLQLLVKKAGKKVVLKRMPKYGEEFWRACTVGNHSKALEMVLNWQNSIDSYSGTIRKHSAEWKPESVILVNEIAGLFDSVEMRKIQTEAANREAQNAWKQAERWARDARGSHAVPDSTEFGVFFNLIVMNRNSHIPSFGDVKRLKRASRDGSALMEAFDWLASAADPMRQANESRKNAIVWQSTLPQGKSDLFLLAYLSAKRLDRDAGSFQALNLNRSGTLICGKGWVNGGELKLRQFAPGINDSRIATLHASPSEISAAKIPMPEDYFQKALAITAQMETSNSLASEGSWGAVADDFDGGGISCGLLQWNHKSGTLQPLALAEGKETILKYMPVYGEEFWQACTSTDKIEARSIILRWQNSLREVKANGGNRGSLKFPILAELRNLFNSPEMRGRQLDDARMRAKGAWDYAVKWAKDQRGADKPTLREFAVIFDTYVHLGGMRVAGDREGDKKRILGYSDVKAFKEERKGKEVTEEIFDWLRDVSSAMRQSQEAHENAEIWRKKLSQDESDLFVLCYLRAQKATGDGGRVKALALCRRGVILFNEGRINSSTYYFAKILAQ